MNQIVEKVVVAVATAGVLAVLGLIYNAASGGQLIVWMGGIRASDAATKQELDNLKNLVQAAATRPELESLKKRVDSAATKADLDELGLAIPKDAVVAFDRSAQISSDSSPGACPKGWTFFEDGGGRVIIGAGIHSNIDENGADLAEYPAYADDAERAVGGSEKQTLTTNNIPEHKHGLNHQGITSVYAEDKKPDNIKNNFNILGDKYALVTHNTLSTTSEGLGESFEAMPPFIALYFCKKNAQ